MVLSHFSIYEKANFISWQSISDRLELCTADGVLTNTIGMFNDRLFCNYIQNCNGSRITYSSIVGGNFNSVQETDCSFADHRVRADFFIRLRKTLAKCYTTSPVLIFFSLINT